MVRRHSTHPYTIDVTGREEKESMVLLFHHIVFDHSRSWQDIHGLFAEKGKNDHSDGLSPAPVTGPVHLGGPESAHSRVTEVVERQLSYTPNGARLN